MNWNMEKVEKALETIKSKAAADAEFRALCLSNPGKAVQQATVWRYQEVLNCVW